MKIVYILKKGFQYYPPCLAQVLYLNDLGIDLVVYHGKNSKHISRIFKERGIQSYTLSSDGESKSSLKSYLNFISYTREIKKILLSLPKDVVLWFGNCESAITLGSRIRRYKFVLTVLELYQKGSLYDHLIRRIIPYAQQVICCEKHRAAIMKDYYCLNRLPHIIPNKPYNTNTDQNNGFTERLNQIKKKYMNKKLIIYQGLIQADRPIDTVALALKEISDNDLVLVIMGKADEATMKKIKGLYTNTEFIGYIPAPEHLEFTKLAHIGVAIYDDSNLNNQFCAPNKIYEYAAFGIPMITSENLGLTETVGLYEAGMCVDFKNVSQLVKAIEIILKEYDVFSSNAKNFYDAFDGRKAIEKIANLIS